MDFCGRLRDFRACDCFFGNKGFDRVENVLAIIKMAAIVMFLVLAVALLAGWIGGGKYNPKFPISYKDFFLPAVWDYGHLLFLPFMHTEVLKCSE